MRILVGSVVLSLSLGATVMSAAVVPASVSTNQGAKAGSNREAVRSQLSAYFKGIARNSPTVLGGLAQSPEAMAAIQDRIARMDEAELGRFAALMADAPDWKVAPEAFAGAFPPEVLQQVRRVGADYAEQVPKGEIMRDDVGTLVGVLKLLPDSKLAELGVSRKMIASLEETFSGMTPLQVAMLRSRVEATSPWRERSATALHALPPALQRGAAALNEHGPLTAKDVAELNQFRDELVGLMTRIDELPPAARKNLNALNFEGLHSQVAQLSKAPPDVLFMVRHNMPQEVLRSLRANVAMLERVSNFTKEESEKIELFRDDLSHAFRQVHAEGEEEWQGVDAMLAKLGPEHLFLLRQRMESIGGWQAALPAVYQTLVAPETRRRIQAVQGATPDRAAVESLEAFRQQALSYIDAVAPTSGLDPAFVSNARKVIAASPLDRLELIRGAVGRLPASASIADRLAIVVMHDINFNCSLSMTAVPEVCVPEECVPEICAFGICTPSFCTPGFCTPAVTVTANFDVICNPIEDALEGVEHSITGTANAAVETMRAAIQTSLNAVQTSINASIASVNNVVNTSVSAITDTVNSIYAFVQTIPDLAWSAIKAALNLLLDIPIRNGVTIRDLVSRGTQEALTSMKTLLGLSSGWWNAVSTFTLPAIPCPPAGFHTPFGDVGDGAAVANYARYRLMIDGIVGMIPDTETSLAIKVPAQVTYMLFDFLGLCLEQAAADADSAETTARHTLVLTNFSNMQAFVTAEIAGLTTGSSQQTTAVLDLLTAQNASTQATAIAQSQAIQTVVNSQNTASQTLVNAESDAIQALLLSETDALQKDVRDFRDLHLRMTIESVLQAGLDQEIASFQLREPWGHLDTVKKIVQETISSMTIAQEGVGLAQKYFDDAVLLMNAGKYKTAFREFMKAYRETTR